MPISPVVAVFTLLWNVWQQSELDDQQERAKSIEEQLETLRALHVRHHELLRKLLVVLEKHLGQDIDGDGVIGEILADPEFTGACDLANSANPSAPSSSADPSVPT